ncbi:MAG: DUF3427 domain-containing protein [Anaerorhabdus sp.]|uniref:DUF3427 domain-containing protein n=1 Tax=Anaerorhabdus sp. TaxID=1872524 RepID=UPI003A8B8AA5
MRQTLLSLKEKGIKGKLITSTYLDFNTPKVFEQLLSLDNIEVRINPCEGFHPKGYIFQNKNDYKVLIDSSNLTQYALSVNQEWNISLNSFLNEPITQQVFSEFNEQWGSSFDLTQNWIENYKKTYINPTFKSRKPGTDKLIFTPNKMQLEALESLENLRHNNQNRALVISATGTGKTFLSAFDVRNAKPNKVLFVVHRENIAIAAMNTFKKVIDSEDFGMFTGNAKDSDKKYTFATIQTMGKQSYLDQFHPDDFDYIIIDEVHHAGAPYYKKLINYFTPKFLLGMTATPERNDDFDIYALFNHNIAYEIRLQQAMEYDLLCPFHYYGITDLTLEGISIDDKTAFNSLVSEDRVNHIIDALNRYQYSGDKVRGLIFVSRIEEARLLSEKFNKLGYRTKSLTGTDSDDIRREYMDRLELEECPEAIDYIFTVDIFNEGIDIPKVNQVVMLRPTESAIIFIQQLGRGLRKHESKEYVVIIVIIGNYEKNFLIPIALSGNMSYNKDSLRQFMIEDSQLLPGASTISFDEISKKKIFQSIDSSNFSAIKLITDSYKKLKLMLGHIPTLFDFDKYNSIDPLLIFNNKSIGSYHMFLKKYDVDYHIQLNSNEEKYLEFISKKFGAGKRIQELELLSIMLTLHNNLFCSLEKNLLSTYNITLSDSCKTTIINEFTQNFQTGSARSTYKDSQLIKLVNNDYLIDPTFKSALANPIFKTLLIDTINFGKYRFEKNYSNRYKNFDLVLYQKYTYEDICRLLNWRENIVPLNISGYKYDKASKTFPIFINYEKTGVHDSINYEDEFVDPYHINAITKSGRSIDSKDVKDILSAKNNEVSIHLFVRKNKDDNTSKEFFYLGTMNPIGTPEEFIMNNTDQNAVRILYLLDTPVRKDIYDYIIS